MYHKFSNGPNGIRLHTLLNHDSSFVCSLTCEPWKEETGALEIVNLKSAELFTRLGETARETCKVTAGCKAALHTVNLKLAELFTRL